jgi:hypothetical protein
MASMTTAYGVSEIVFGLEISDESILTSKKRSTVNGKTLGATIAADGLNTIITQNIYSAIDATVSQYLLNNTQVVGTYINSTQILFNKGWATAPSPLPPNSINNFIFFANGVYIEPSSIVSFVNNITTSILTIDPTILEYSFEQSDLLIGLGKFN